MPKPRPADLRELRSEIIRNAAFVAHEGQKARKLTRWLQHDERRRVIFLFDTDVIVTYCAPWLTGPTDDKSLGNGYGQILPLRPFEEFSADERQALLFKERRRAEGVGWLLGSKALHRSLDLHIPMLQTKSHFEETLKIYNNVKARARVEADIGPISTEERQDRQIGQTLRLVKAAVAEGERSPVIGDVGSYLSNVLRSIQARDLQRSSRFVREWDAFLDVVRWSGGILKLSEFRPVEGSFAPELATLWNQIAEKIEVGNAAKTMEALGRSLEKFVVPEHHRFNRERGETDSRALAEVAYVNQCLSEMGPDLVRVVIVTGDRKLVLALATAKEVLAVGNHNTIADFAFDHVHHLWSFVDTISADVFAVRSPQGQGRDNEHTWRSELFSGLLAFEDKLEADPPSFDRLAKNACRAEPDLAQRILRHDIDQAYRRWEEFSEGAANLHRHFLFDEEKYRHISLILIEKLKTKEFDVDENRLRALVVETMARARDRTNVEFSEIGANSILTAHDHGIRNPPDLMFDSLTVTDKIFRDLALPRRVFLNAEDFSARFERIADDCYRPDPENPFDDDYREECYVKYLVLGALFASANRWLVAEQHAENAINIVVRANTLRVPIRILNPSAGTRFTNMSGREAHYLFAIASHVRASTTNRYDFAQAQLQKARACLEEDRKKGTALRVPFIRFDCESLAIALGRYYHARASGSDDPSEFADQVFRNSLKLLGAREAMHRSADDPAVADGDKIGSLRASTKTSIATNLIQVAVIARFRNNKNYTGTEVSPVDQALLQGALDDLVQDTNLLSELAGTLGHDVPDSAPEDPAVICSPLTMLYAVAGAMLARDRRIWGPTTQKDIDYLFERQQANVTEYDSWRFDALRTFCKSLMPE